MKNYATADTARLDRIADRANRRWPDRYYWCSVNDTLHCYAIFCITRDENPDEFRLMRPFYDRRAA